MCPTTYCSSNPTFVHNSSDVDCELPIDYQSLSATNKSKEGNIWPVHRHASFLFSALITGCFILAVLLPMGAIVTNFVPDTSEATYDSFERRSYQATRTNVLSWPSACWALIAIGINTMCQPFGRVLGLPHQHSFALRSSPIICIVDSFAMLLQFVCRGIQRRSAFEGVNLTVQARFAGVQVDKDGSFAALRKNTVFRVLLFLLGAFPQAIKLYAVRGVPWTQALATVYLASFMLSETAAVIARPDRTQQVPSNQNTPRYAKLWVLSIMGVLVVSTGLAYIIFTGAIFVIVRNYWTYPAWPLILFACLINILYVCSTVSSKREALILCSGPLVSVSGASLSGAVAPALSAVQFSLLFTTMIVAEHRKYAAMLAIVVTLAVISTFISFYRLTQNISSRYASYMHFELSGYFFLLHLITAYLGFGLLYIPTSTVKPAWTDALG